MKFLILLIGLILVSGCVEKEAEVNPEEECYTLMEDCVSECDRDKENSPDEWRICIDNCIEERKYCDWFKENSQEGLE